jgi:hypothetical protein
MSLHYCCIAPEFRKKDTKHYCHQQTKFHEHRHHGSILERKELDDDVAFLDLASSALHVKTDITGSG